MLNNQKDKYDISSVIEILKSLRDPYKGCPWDLKQTFETIAPYTLEEAYEVVDAISRGDLDDLKDELGDLLFQVVYHSQMAREIGAFSFSDVVAAICKKMIRRHPHVFGENVIADANAQERKWEAIKRKERGGNKNSILDGIALALPAVVRAKKLGKRAALVGFDWDSYVGAREKLNEELAELDAAIAEKDAGSIAAEMGDVFLSLVSFCRHLNIEPEACVSNANSRFEKRFRILEKNVIASEKNWDDFSGDDLEALWQDAKLETQ